MVGKLGRWASVVAWIAVGGCATADPYVAPSRDASVVDVTAPAVDRPSDDRHAAPDRASPLDVPDVPVALDVTAVVDVPVDVRPAGFGRLGTTARDGDTVTLRTNPTTNYRGVDTAYDPVHRVFLVVYGNAPIGGAFLDDEGRQIGDGFALTDSDNWTQNPRVAWGGGGFLASWHREAGRTVVPLVRRVVYAPSGPVFGGEATVIGPAGSMQESCVSLAWSDEAAEFLAVWSFNGVHARRIGADGTPRGDGVVFTDPGVWTEQPSVVWSPAARAYFVVFMQTTGELARVALQRLDATGAAVGALRDLTGPIAFAKVTDVAYDAAAGAVIATWYQVRDGVRGFAAQRFGGDGEPLGASGTVFVPHGSYDGYDLAWSPATGTSFAAFHGETASAMGAELDDGLRYATPFAVTASGSRNGDYLPRVVAHPSRPLWLVLSSADYARVVLQRVTWRGVP